MHTNDPTEVQRVEDTVVVGVFKVVGRPDLPTHTALVFDRKHERSACHDTSETQQRLSQKTKQKECSKDRLLCSLHFVHNTKHCVITMHRHASDGKLLFPDQAALASIVLFHIYITTITIFYDPALHT